LLPFPGSQALDLKLLSSTRFLRAYPNQTCMSTSHVGEET
jgi:hypothetical protein